jgi:hypothetical protein
MLAFDEFESGLGMLELTHQDIACIGRADNRFVELLREYKTYANSANSFHNANPKFSYADPSDPHLATLREQYNLNGIAGKGSEIDRLRNLMHWVHGLAIHTSNAVVPEAINSLSLLQCIQKKGVHINCSMYAIILNEAYLAMGWRSRIIHLKPFQKEYIESHVVNAVYCQQLQKWLFFDPNLNAYFMDEWDQILSVAEIRQRLINGSGLQVNDGLAFNSDNRVFSSLGQQYGKDFYRLYIAKNIFRYSCPQKNTVNRPSGKINKNSIELLPTGYHFKRLSKPPLPTSIKQILYTTDIHNFWQRPLVKRNGGHEDGIQIHPNSFD